MSDDFSLIHGNTLEYDFRSGFSICRACEDKCTCGPDYFDRYCPRHGTELPEKKWENLQ